MAEDVAPQEDLTDEGGVRTLHLKVLRKQWQVVAVQVIATLALLWLYLQMGDTFGSCSPQHVDDSGNSLWCPALDHTLTLQGFENMMRGESGDPDWQLPFPDFLTGVGNEGPGRYYGPLLLCGLVAGGWVLLNFQTPQRRRQVYLGVLVGLILFLAGRMLLGWFWGMLYHWDLYWPFSVDPARNHAVTLVYPLTVYSQVFLLAIYFIPVWTGLMGIWGLSRRMIGWSLGTVLVYLGLYALLSFESVMAYFDIGLAPLASQVGSATALGGLVSPDIWPLLLMALLMLIYSESGFAVIRHLEYAFRLPESCKKDPEYVNQFDNMLNGHLVHTVGIFFAVALCTMLALKFDDLLLDLVSLFGVSQWSGQVQESLELRLTYGKVISGMLFLIFVAGLRFVVPWQRITGFFETYIPKLALGRD